MQLCISLPAVLLWGQPHEEKKDKAEENENEKTEFVQNKNENNNNNAEQADSYNMCLDICFWAWLFGTTAWSLGESTVFLTAVGPSD